MNSRVEPPQSHLISILQGLILLVGASFFLVPIATDFGLLTGLGGLALASFLAAANAKRIKLGSGLIVSFAIVAVGLVVQRLLLATSLFPPGLTLTFADGLSLGLVCLGLGFGVRLLSIRLRGFSVLEFAGVVAAVTHSLASHRHDRIHQPRVLSDFAWMNGIDPQTLLTGAGVAVVVAAAMLLLRVRKSARAILALALLLLFGVLALQLGSSRPTRKVEDDLGLTKNDDDKKDEKDNEGKGSGNSDGQSNSPNKPPNPVALALLQDELPELPVLYFRQTVRSKLVGDKLEVDDSGQFDSDIPRAFPTTGPLTLPTTQEPKVHDSFSTTMFLLVDHAQLPGLGHVRQLALLENPDPRRYVTVYDVKSQLLGRPLERLFGRQALPEAWSEAERQHYLAVPKDPRYQELSDSIVREVDPRFVGDDVMKAFAIKQHLEKKGFYSLKQKQLVGDQPTAEFLFGDMKGYCVHFAHAATFLLRSQGIPARVALGYGVQTQRRGAGSAVLIYGQDAHAWPELYLDGIGWVTFDIMPEASDEPPRPPVEQEMEVVFGELARKEPATQTLARALQIPWGKASLVLLAALLLVAYGIKLSRRMLSGSHVHVYRGVLDRLVDVGGVRQYGESREEHARRLAAAVPSFPALTSKHLRLALRGLDPETEGEFRRLADETKRELAENVPFLKRAGGALNPIGWWFSR